MILIVYSALQQLHFNFNFNATKTTEKDDVTSQVIKAYNTVIKPSIKDYLPKRDELLSSANQIFKFCTESGSDSVQEIQPTLAKLSCNFFT